MHETVGHLRNSIRNNRGSVKAVLKLNEDGSWVVVDPKSVFEEHFS